ncbi:sugar phosphate isomerase/epimerase family protein [Marinicrinis lubricantis]|uniref:Sugar phosphate isomerase/epimerase family protein n=1 Tax=Marinicrinis lubricantis TaxID=2086470 RepID=A0ABW1ISU0_9BACL
MRLSTSTNLCAVNRTGPLTDPIEGMKRLAEAGYRVLDFNFRFIKFEEFFLARDDWEQELDKIGNEAAKLGIEFSQSHIPYYHPINEIDSYLTDPELHAWFESMCERSLHASAALGVKWAVAHPFTAVDENCEREASKRKNLAYFAPYVELAKKLGIGIAIENMSDFYGSIIQRRYAATYEDLVDLVDAFQDESVGICWDFGHANIMKYDQSKALTYIGRRLKATHVNDNFGVSDTHNLPFMGTVRWEDVMRTLVQIGYEGDFTYEIHGMADRLPPPLKPEALQYSYEVGQYLLSLAK